MDGMPESELQDGLCGDNSTVAPLTSFLNRLRQLPTTIAPGHFYGRYKESLASARSLRYVQIPGKEGSPNLEAIYVPLRLAQCEGKRKLFETQGEDSQNGRVAAEVPSGGGRGEAIGIQDALLRSSRIVLLGGPGSGKSTLLRRLALMVLHDELPARYVRRLTFTHQDRATDALIPILVSLPDLAECNDGLMGYLIRFFADHGFPHAGTYLEQRLEAGQCLLLLDGLSNLDRAADRGKVLEQIRALTTAYGDRNQVIVSSRWVGYRGELDTFAHFGLLPFDDKDIEALLRRWFVNHGLRADSLLAALEARPAMRSMAGNPLLLSVLAVAWEREGTADVRAVDLYGTSVDILLDEADGDQPLRACARRLAYVAQSRGRSSLALEEMSSILQEVPSDSPGGGSDVQQVLKTLVEETDLLEPVSEDAYGFAHSSLQAHLAAEEILKSETLTDLIDNATDDRWREVIPLVAGLQQDATELIRGILAGPDQSASRALLLAGACLQEASGADEALRAEVRRELFEAFERDEPELWRQAAVALAGIAGQSVRDAFTGFLRSGDPELRVRAARALGRICEDWAAPPLIAALGDEVPNVRRAAAWALGGLGDNRAVYSLVKLLGDSDEDVRREASKALGSIGQPALRPLVGAVGDRSARVSARAAAALGRLGSPAIPVLLDALDSERVETRESAIQALASIGPPATEPLVDALGSDSPQIRCGAVDALGRIGDHESLGHIVVALGDPEDVVREEAAEKLQHIGAPAVSPLIEALVDDRRWVSGGAAELLPKLGDPAVDGLFEALRGDRRAIRYAATKVLGKIGTGDSGIVSRLADVLEDPRAEVRQTAVRALAQIGDEAAVEILVRALEAEEEALQEEVTQALVSLGSDRVVWKLREAFNRGVDPQRVIGVVSRIKARPARDFLRELLGSEDRSIRNLAAFALEADDRSGLYYYRAWERSIEERLLKRGTATTAMLSGTPSELRPVVLQRYVSSHPQTDLAYDAEMAVLHLNAIETYKRVADGWERAVQNIDGDSPLSGQIFAECVKNLVNTLCEILGVTVVRTEVYERLHCFILQASAIIHGTNLPQQIPLIFLQGEQLTERDLDSLRELFARIRVFHRTALLIVFSDGEHVQQARQLVDDKLRDVHAFDVIVLGMREMQHVVTAKKPPDALRFIICDQADLTLVSPYSCDEPASRNLFFGREFEIRTATQAIVNNSVAILGGRRIGKTSILHRVNEVLRESYSCYYLDCHPIRDYDILFRTMAYHWPRLESLAPEPVSFHSAVADLSNDRMLIFIFDEIDALLRFDMANDELLFKTFRSLSQEGMCRFIFSGERVLSNQLKYGSQSPLFNFCGQRIQLGYLEQRSARQLVTEPMSWMNIELREEERVVGDILELSSCHPRLVQYICHSLIRAINREEVRFITPEQVQRIAGSNEFREEYLYTVWGDATSFERALTLALENTTFTRKEIQAALERQDIPYTWEGLKSALHNLKICSVLRQDNAMFHFVAERFPKVARESLDIEMEISSLRRKIRREQDL